MWMAMAVVSSLQAAVLGLAVLSFDWVREARRASHNVQQGRSLLAGREHGKEEVANRGERLQA